MASLLIVNTLFIDQSNGFCSNHRLFFIPITAFLSIFSRAECNAGLTKMFRKLPKIGWRKLGKKKTKNEKRTCIMYNIASLFIRFRRKCTAESLVRVIPITDVNYNVRSFNSPLFILIESIRRLIVTSTRLLVHTVCT